LICSRKYILDVEVEKVIVETGVTFHGFHAVNIISLEFNIFIIKVVYAKCDIIVIFYSFAVRIPVIG